MLPYHFYMIVTLPVRQSDIITECDDVTLVPCLIGPTISCVYVVHPWCVRNAQYLLAGDGVSFARHSILYMCICLAGK